MPEIREIDTVMRSVRYSANRFGLQSEGTIGQQILLLGDSFYGYRFTANDFTAVWSASDQTLKMFDSNGKCLGNMNLSVLVEQTFDQQDTLRFADTKTSKAA